MLKTDYLINNDRQLWQSQNFLKNPELVAYLIEKADISREDLVVEIGPGKGMITQILARKARQVIAVEIDSKFVKKLRNTFHLLNNVKLVHGDFLKWQLPNEPYKVFSNIPFNMTADIVRKLTEDRNPPLIAYLIMQDKAAFRFIGKPKELQISILLKPWFEISIVADIDRRGFVPIPKINAVLVAFKKREQPLIKLESRQWFRDFVVYGYNQWQPTIMDAFRQIFSPKQRIIIEKKLKIKGAKPSDLNFEQWIKLFEIFTLHVPSNKKVLVKGAEERLKKQQKNLKKWHRTR